MFSDFIKKCLFVPVVVRSDAYPAHASRWHLQLLGRGTAPSRGRWQKDRGRLSDVMVQLLVSSTARSEISTKLISKSHWQFSNNERACNI